MVADKPDVVTELQTLLTAEQAKDQPRLPADLAGLPE